MKLSVEITLTFGIQKSGIGYAKEAVAQRKAKRRL